MPVCTIHDLIEYLLMANKTILITGAARGLGRTLALTLAKRGHSIIVNYLKAVDDAEEVARLAGNGSRAIRADVGELSEVLALASGIEAGFGRLDAVINNAGITTDKILLRQTEEEWDAVIRTNLTGNFQVIRTMLPLLIRSGGGHIINISSRSGLRGRAGQPAYSASKAGVIGLTLSAAQECAAYGIRVNALMPGYLETDMGRQAGAAMKEAVQQSLLKKLSAGQEAADFIAFLLETDGITGQVFSLDSRII